MNPYRLRAIGKLDGEVGIPVVIPGHLKPGLEFYRLVIVDEVGNGGLRVSAVVNDMVYCITKAVITKPLVFNPAGKDIVKASLKSRKRLLNLCHVVNDSLCSEFASI